METAELTLVQEKHIPYCKEVDLFFESGVKNYVLYKPAGKRMSEIRVNSGRHPELYVNNGDKKKVAIKAQQNYNRTLEKEIKGGNPEKVREVLVNIVEDVFAEPRSGTMDLLPDTMNLILGQYVDQPQNLKALATLSFKDYTTAIHSINVMALVSVYCFHVGYSMEETMNMGLGALYHDIGKTLISSKILKAPRKLTGEEFEIMKSHTSKGFRLIADSNLDNECILHSILHHHEKLDGSGYPKNLSDISECGQILGIIDCYEALTNESRPYRDAMAPLDALKLIKDDVEKGKYSKIIFEKFAYSLI